MTVKEALFERRSVRSFTQEPVSEEMVDALLRAAMCAPSACDKRPWEFYVVKDAGVLEQLKGASHFSNIAAPLAIVVCGSLARALPAQLADYWVQDCSAATENILLQAVELGLGTVWCGIYLQKQAEKNVSAILKLPEDNIPLNIIYIGHPAKKPEGRCRYDEQRVHRVG